MKQEKDLNIVNVSFRIIAIREAHHNKIVHNMVAHTSRIFGGNQMNTYRGQGRAEDPNSLEDVAVAGRTSRITLEHISISITHMTSGTVWPTM